MRVRRLRIENFRKFRAPVVVDGFTDGLNLVCEPNETGKSTVLDALRAALFERHSAKSDRIRSFRPQGDEVAPSVELAFDVNGEEWRLTKRFLLSPSVTLEGPEGRFASDAAEEKLQGLLGFARAGNRGADDDSRGALGLLWVEQGQSFLLGSPGETARRTLEEALAGEIGAVTGGRRAKAVVAQVEKALEDFLTPGGKPTKRLKQAMEAAEAARLAATERARELEQFEGVLEQLEYKRNERRRLVRDIEDPQTDADLKKLDEDIARARAAGQALEIATLAVREQSARRSALEERRAGREKLATQLQAAEAKVAGATEAVSTHAEVISRVRSSERAAALALEAARTALREAETRRDQSVAERAAAERRFALAAAFARLDRAEAHAANIRERETRIAASRMDAAAVDRLRQLEDAESAARAQAEAGAATLTVTLEPGAPQILLDGTPLTEGAIRLSRPRTLAIPGVGTIAFAPPPSGEPALARLRAARRDLADFLAGVGHDTPQAARTAGRARAIDEAELLGLRTRLKAECPADAALGIPAGLDPLRGALAGVERPFPEAKDAAFPAADVETPYRAARAAETEAAARREAALESLKAGELKEVALAAALERAEAERARLAADLAADRAALADEDLAAALEDARAAEARALVDCDTARRAAEGLDADGFIRRRDTLRKKRDTLQSQLPELAGAVARLEEQARTLGGEGPASRKAAADEEAEAAAAAHARLKSEADTLALLLKVLKEAQQDAARRYLAPVTRRIEPYVRRLLPSASLSFGEDLKPQLLTRAGREEAAEMLSKGTQEQIAILTRLAFADLLIDKGQPASLVLDDALVFADDDRFDTMMEILSEASGRMQVLVLSCRASAYRAMAATRLSIRPA
ncbi:MULTISPECIES: AAA family ATPase [Xanthobacter]|uniref:AAA family ATPase n=1 Tax=Xanthobacter aminoxidans TaxID=186280 RepID=A0ABW6ZL80_9HYPH|nr:AAA family ATPase [Xanthobacter sp. 91]